MLPDGHACAPAGDAGNLRAPGAEMQIQGCRVAQSKKNSPFLNHCLQCVFHKRGDSATHMATCVNV